MSEGKWLVETLSMVMQQGVYAHTTADSATLDATRCGENGCFTSVVAEGWWRLELEAVLIGTLEKEKRQGVSFYVD